MMGQDEHTILITRFSTVQIVQLSCYTFRLCTHIGKDQCGVMTGDKIV